MILAQDIPDYGMVLDASNNFIIDQGIAALAMIIIAIIAFGMLILMFMMLRQMGKESKQQDKLITQSGLNQIIVQRVVEEQHLDREERRQNTDEIIDLKKLMEKLIEIQTQDDNDKKNIIQSGIKSIEENTESVNTMQEKFDTLESAVQLAVATMQRVTDNGIKLSQQAEDDLVAAITKDLKATIDKCLQDAIKSTQETPATPKPKTETKEESKS